VRLAASLLLAAGVAVVFRPDPAAAADSITIDGAAGRVFDGIGAIRTSTESPGRTVP
jgi:hypothetical protein